VSKHSSAFFTAGGRRISHTYIAATGRTVRNRASSAVVVVVARGLAEKEFFFQLRRGERGGSEQQSQRNPHPLCAVGNVSHDHQCISLVYPTPFKKSLRDHHHHHHHLCAKDDDGCQISCHSSFLLPPSQVWTYFSTS